MRWKVLEWSGYAVINQTIMVLFGYSILGKKSARFAMMDGE